MSCCPVQARPAMPHSLFLGLCYLAHDAAYSACVQLQEAREGVALPFALRHSAILMRASAILIATLQLLLRLISSWLAPMGPQAGVLQHEGFGAFEWNFMTGGPIMSYTCCLPIALTRRCVNHTCGRCIYMLHCPNDKNPLLTWRTSPVGQLAYCSATNLYSSRLQPDMRLLPPPSV